ncbi:MAG: flippase-like domain-containing protein [Acidobacteria bacterium]|nr:flippase-like domain-containing protein [Acidobacteriota bacterium]
MSQNVKPKSASRRLAPAGIIFAVLGVLLFAYFVWRAGPGDIRHNISKIGAGFLLIIALAGLRFVVRAYAWTLCFEEPHRLGFWDAFKAYLIGDTVGNIVPLGIVVSEPTKAALVRDRVPLVAGLSAIAVENLFYMLSVCLFIFSGASALLLSFPLPKGLRWSSMGIIAGVLVAIVPAAFAVHRQWRFLSGVLEFMLARGVGRRRLASKREAAIALEDRIYGFYARNGARFVPLLMLESSFHMLGVLRSQTKEQELVEG